MFVIIKVLPIATDSNAFEPDRRKDETICKNYKQKHIQEIQKMKWLNEKLTYDDIN